MTREGFANALPWGRGDRITKWHQKMSLRPVWEGSARYKLCVVKNRRGPTPLLFIENDASVGREFGNRPFHLPGVEMHRPGRT